MALLQIFNRLWVLAVFLLRISTLSDAAFPNLAPGMTPEQTTMVQQAFSDAMSMARAVALTFNSQCDPYFNRYFAEADATFVKNMFQQLINIDFDDAPITNRDDLTRLLGIPLTPDYLSDEYAKLSISYGDHPSIPRDYLAAYPKCQNYRLRGWFISWPEDPEVGFISICASTFGAYYPIGVTLVPPDALRATPGMTCDGLGDHETDYMRSPGQTLLHELMHWGSFFADVPNYDAKIRRLPDDFAMISDYKGLDPPNGANPFYCHRVRNLPDSGGYSEALNNAESYAVYATVRLWSWLCGTHSFFGPSPSVNDYRRRISEWRRLNPPPQPAPQEPAIRPERSEGIDADEEPDDEGGCTYYEEWDFVVCT